MKTPVLSTLLIPTVGKMSTVFPPSATVAYDGPGIPETNPDEADRTSATAPAVPVVPTNARCTISGTPSYRQGF